VVNKADRPEARSTLRQLRAALQLGPMPADGWRPPVLAVVATTAEGIDRLAGAITDHLALLRAGDRIAELELERARRALRAIVEEQALEQALGREQGALWEEQARRVARREADPYSAALVLLGERG
jgi:LAO/AO transport system kinase